MINYPLAPDKIEIKREMLTDYQLKIANLYNIPIGNVKKLVPNFFDNEIYVIHHENLQLYLKLGLKFKKNTWHIRIQSQWLKQYVEFNTQQRKEAKKKKKMVAMGKCCTN